MKCGRFDCENVSASAQLYLPLSTSSAFVTFSWLRAGDVNKVTENRGSFVGSSSSPLYMTSGLSQPGSQKYHRTSRSESVTQSKVTVEPTLTLAFDDVDVIRLSVKHKTYAPALIVFSLVA